MRTFPVKLLQAVIDNLPFADEVKGEQLNVPVTSVIGLNKIYDGQLVLGDMNDLVFIKDDHNKEWSLLMT